MKKIEIPAAEGRAFEIDAGKAFRIVTPKGFQAADFFAFNAANTREFLSPNHTLVRTRCIKPRQGDVLLSCFRRPMLDFVEDQADGVHDMMIAACDQHRYDQLGVKGPHASCSDNLRASMQRLGYAVDVIPQPINFFTHTRVDSDGALASPPNPVRSGAYVQLQTKMDLICVVSSCPFDVNLPDWSINANTGPTELLVEPVGDTFTSKNF